jgi:hypothetical protein
VALLDDLKAARDNLAAELRNETARRVALTAAGNPPPTTYSFAGRSLDWNGWLKAVRAEIQSLATMIAAEEIPEANVRVWS